MMRSIYSSPTSIGSDLKTRNLGVGRIYKLWTGFVTRYLLALLELGVIAVRRGELDVRVLWVDGMLEDCTAL